MSAPWDGLPGKTSQSKLNYAQDLWKQFGIDPSTWLGNTLEPQAPFVPEPYVDPGNAVLDAYGSSQGFADVFALQDQGLDPDAAYVAFAAANPLVVPQDPTDTAGVNHFKGILADYAKGQSLRAHAKSKYDADSEFAKQKYDANIKNNDASRMSTAYDDFTGGQNISAKDLVAAYANARSPQGGGSVRGQFVAPLLDAAPKHKNARAKEVFDDAVLRGVEAKLQASKKVVTRSAANADQAHRIMALYSMLSGG